MVEIFAMMMKSITIICVANIIRGRTLGSSGRGPTRKEGPMNPLFAPRASDAALTVSRLALSLLMLGHGLWKLGAWGGPGYAGTLAFFTEALHLPAVVAFLVLGVEIAGAACLALGAFTRIAAAGVIATMLGAIATVHWPHGFFMNWTGAGAGEASSCTSWRSPWRASSSCGAAVGPPSIRTSGAPSRRARPSRTPPEGGEPATTTSNEGNEHDTRKRRQAPGDLRGDPWPAPSHPLLHAHG
jgi:uncharacterized membrane protein YphA (DoxX/SURF4 family)